MITEQLNNNFFKQGVSNWNNHLPLLFLALEETKIGKVLELGCGIGSTSQLHFYCEKNNRKLISLDNDEKYKNIFQFYNNENHSVKLIESWNEIDNHLDASVVLIDHSPGESRYESLLKFKNQNGIYVCHDSEPHPCGGNYMWDKAFPHFKYKVDIKVPCYENGQNGTWASALSNEYDLTKWIGETFSQYVVS